MATIWTLAANVVARTGNFEKGMHRSRKSLYGLQKGIYNTQRRLVNFTKFFIAGGGLIYGLRSTVKAYAAFEKQLAMVSTMLDKHTMHLMPQYRVQLQRLAIDYGEATQTLSKGLYDILSATIAPSKAMETLTVAVKAAKAGFTDTAIAANAIIRVLKAYNLSADQAADVSDLLFAVVKRGVTTFGELAPTIGRIAGIARTAGVSLEQLGAAIAMLTRVLPTEIAMTGLRAILTSFLKPTKDSIEAAAKFGLALNTTTLRTIGLTGALMKLKSASAEQIAAIFPNVRALTGFAAGLSQVADMAEDMEIMLNRAGLTQEAYTKATDTLSHDLDRLTQAYTAAKVAIGSVFRPQIQSLTTELLLLATAFREGVGGNYAFTSSLYESLQAYYEFGDAITNLDELFVGLGMREKTYAQQAEEAGKKAEFYAQLAARAVDQNIAKLNEQMDALIKNKQAAKNAASGMHELTEEMKKQIEEREKLIKAAERMREAIRTPIEQYEAQVRLIKSLRELLGEKDYYKAMLQAQEKLQKALGIENTMIERLTKQFEQLNKARESGYIGLEKYKRGLEGIRKELEAAIKKDEIGPRYPERAGEAREIRPALVSVRGLQMTGMIDPTAQRLDKSNQLLDEIKAEIIKLVHKESLN